MYSQKTDKTNKVNFKDTLLKTIRIRIKKFLRVVGPKKNRI